MALKPLESKGYGNTIQSGFLKRGVVPPNFTRSFGYFDMIVSALKLCFGGKFGAKDNVRLTRNCAETTLETIV